MKKGIAQHQIGDKFDDFMLIKESRRGVASNGKPFLTLILIDDTGEIDAKLWDISKEDETTFQQETIIKLGGEIHQFRGRAQLKIMSIRPAQPTDDVKMDDFVQKAPLAKDTLMEKLTEAIFEMQNPKLQRMVRAFIKKYQDELLSYPAAVKNHHEYVSGLAYHVVSMLGVAKELCNLYPQLNKDLLYAGIILHDLGKVKELSGTVTTTYTFEGKLLGHIPIMVEEIQEMANELQIDGEEIVILKHIILSHHGKPEWGSAKVPYVQEAEIVHMIDMLDAKMNMLDKALSKTSPGEFTERLFAMDNRSFYKPAFKNE